MPMPTKVRGTLKTNRLDIARLLGCWDGGGEGGARSPKVAAPQLLTDQHLGAGRKLKHLLITDEAHVLGIADFRERLQRPLRFLKADTERGSFCCKALLPFPVLLT